VIPSLHEVKVVVSDSLKHGDRAKLAQLRGVGFSAVSQAINPNLDTPCPVFKALHFLNEISQVNKQSARQIWIFMGSVAEPMLADEVQAYCSDGLLGCAATEFADIVRSRLEGRPLPEQRREIIEAIEALQKLLASFRPAEVTA